jgi:hypothetical protein
MKETQSEGISLRWNGKFIAIVGSIIVALSSFTSFQVTHFIDTGKENQRQNDRLDDIERRTVILEGIAKVNTDRGIRLEEQLAEIGRQHGYMLEELRLIHQILDQREARIKKQKLQNVPLIEDEEFMRLPGLNYLARDMGMLPDAPETSTRGR